MVLVEQPTIVPQCSDKRGELAIFYRAQNLLHDEHLPRSGWVRVREGQRASIDEISDEVAAADASIHAPSKLRIERYRSVEQDGGDRFVIVGAQDAVRKIFSITGLNTLFELPEA